MLVRHHGLPDAVILDVDMPDMDGLDLLTRLRELRPALPALFLTVLWSGEVQTRIRAAPVSLSSSLPRTLGFTALYVLATYAGRLTVMDETNLSLVWPAAGVSAVWFLAQRSSRWFWLDLIALTVVTMAVNTATGAPPALALFFVVANLAQALVFSYLFRRWLLQPWGGGGDQPSRGCTSCGA